MSTTLVSAALTEPEVHEPARRRGWAPYLLIAPGTIWMLLFLVLPIAMMVYVSFWTQTTFTIKPILTTKSWQTFFSSETYLASLWTTIRIWLLVLAATLVVGYPTALFVGLFVRNRTLSTVLLVLCVIPFWTSFLIRVLAWRPMLGKEGAVNLVLMKIGIISQPIDVLLFTDVSVIIGMVQIYVVFMVGPVAFMLGRIDRSLIEAASCMGSSFRQTFLRIYLPLSLPGIYAGCLLVFILAMGFYITPALLGSPQETTISVYIQQQIQELNWGEGTAMAVILVAIVVGLFVVYDRLLGFDRLFRDVGAR